MTIHNIQLTGELGRQANLFTGGGVPKDPVRSRHAQEEEGRMTSTLLSFVLPGSLRGPKWSPSLVPDTVLS